MVIVETWAMIWDKIKRIATLTFEQIYFQLWSICCAEVPTFGFRHLWVGTTIAVKVLSICWVLRMCGFLFYMNFYLYKYWSIHNIILGSVLNLCLLIHYFWAFTVTWWDFVNSHVTRWTSVIPLLQAQSCGVFCFVLFIIELWVNYAIDLLRVGRPQWGCFAFSEAIVGSRKPI